ncbi:alpha/beta fold hydrolase [Phaeacidiphilus oryzae]|uniref:alpha/beta fold hydrolase n=1 Tax=Phaeacidiphilus oryzae TaxID=348818 RepID=UPI0006898B9F|nr:alpha/beta hydrolase [Phaeacidiphilus oryzae]
MAAADGVPAGRTVVLVHGAWHSPWSWHRVVEELDGDGIPSTTVDLPSCRSGPDGAPLGDLHADAAEIRRTLDAYRDVVLVAHSYGGIPATEAAAGHPAVRHLVYVCAYMADEGETLVGYAVPDPGPDILDPPADLEFGEDGTVTVKPERAATLFCADLDPAAAAEAVRHLRPMSATVLRQSPNAVAWRTIPSTYVLTGRDNATPTPVQRELSVRAGQVHELPDSSHSPFLSHPKTVAEIIAIAAGY